MRLLHLSDIHFREPECLNARTDTNRPYRTLLAQDVVNLCQDGRSVDAILVGGDIAYKAHQDEYGAARQWLLDLASRCGCRPERIYVVPGNHDVDWATCRKFMAVEAAQNAIVTAEATARPNTLRRVLSDRDLGSSLFLPLTAYNEFAKYFNCNVFPSDPFWTDNLDLGGGVRLRLFGMTSTLLSGLGNRDDAPGHLYLSPLQTVLDRESDDVNLVLCHHPPYWFSDHHDVDDKVNSRAMLQFFGHEHRQRCTRDKRYMRFAAGAVNPEAVELNWRPGYNLVDVEVSGDGQHRGVDIRAKVRHYQHMPEMFVPVMDGENQPDWTHRLPLPHSPSFQVQAPAAEAPLKHTEVATAARQAAAMMETDTPSPTKAMSTVNTRNLIFRFWNHLSISERREVALKLKLITTDDFSTPEPERYTRALREAANRGLLAELAREIEAIEKK